MIKILSSADWLYKLLICLYNGIVSNYYFKKEMGMVFMNWNCRDFQKEIIKKNKENKKRNIKWRTACRVSLLFVQKEWKLSICNWAQRRIFYIFKMFLERF